MLSDGEEGCSADDNLKALILSPVFTELFTKLPTLPSLFLDQFRAPDKMYIFIY